MNRLDFDAINAALNPEQVVPQWLPDGRRNNNEWVARNPTRADGSPGSFSINLRTGVWKDFAGGNDDWGKDLVSLYAYLFHNNDQGAAARELANDNGITFDAETRERAAQEREENIKRMKQSQPRLVMPVPDDAPPPSFKHHNYGEPTAVWPYPSADGRVMLYVCRFDPAGERKQIVPRSWCDHPGKESRWTWRGITGKDLRPLFGLDRLAAHPDSDVVLVEGEGKAIAGQQIFGDAAVVVGWMGGVETADRVDVKPLAGRRVILFPDFDAQREKLTNEEKEQGIDPFSKPLLKLHEQPGMRAMMAHAQALRGIARETVMVGYTIDPERGGWDLADAKEEGWDLRRVMEYIGQHAGDPWHISSGRPAKPANDNEEDGPLPLEATVNPFGFPHLSAKGQPMNTWENLDYMLAEYEISARYNQVRKQVEVILPGRSYTADNRANCSLAELTSLCARNRMPQSNLQDYVKLIADQHSYSPVADWIASKPWDGLTRLPEILATVTTTPENTQLKDRLLYRWMLSAVAAVFKPHGFTSHGALVFTGPQGQGKTSWVKRLAPAELGVVLEGAAIDPTDKDTVIAAVSHWLVELGELDATFRKADIARLKSFLTLAVDKLRRPYDRIESEYQRRTVFFASVNEPQYLVDDTGNRRWWTVMVTAIDYLHDIDMQQVWAELLTHFQRGEQHWLTKEEQIALNQLNEEHEATDPIMERVQTAFDWADAGGVKTDMTATDVLIAIGFDKPSRKQATECSNVLRKLTGLEPKRKASGRFYAMPRRLTRAGVPIREFEHFDEARPF